jgi:hypothetical protein
MHGARQIDVFVLIVIGGLVFETASWAQGNPATSTASATGTTRTASTTDAAGNAGTAGATSAASTANTISATSSARDPAAAEALFRSGRELLQQSKLEEALAKFEESYRLDPTAGALFNQGECRAKQGKTASAWALYQQAATLADVQGKPDLYDLATTRANQLQADLSYITIHVADPVPGLEVMRDGALVGRAQFDVSLPIDPGRHSITARAPGYSSVGYAVVVGERHDRQTINIPKLRDNAISVPKPPTQSNGRAAAAPTLNAAQTPSNPWPWVIGAAGATSLLVGSVSGLLAIRENHEMSQACPTKRNCSPDVVLAQGRRDTESSIAWIGIPVGVVALGAAASWLWLAREPDSEHSQRGTLAVDTSGRDLHVRLGGQF